MKKQSKNVKSSESILSLHSGAANLIERGEQEIPAMLEMVESKIKALTKNNEEVSDTHGKLLDGFDDISSIDSVTTLVQARSSVNNREKAYIKEMSEIRHLGATLNKFPFVINGCTSAQWVKTIDSRIESLINEKEINKYKSIAEKLKASLSAEQLRQNNLKSIAELLMEDGPLE